MSLFFLRRGRKHQPGGAYSIVIPDTLSLSYVMAHKAAKYAA